MSEISITAEELQAKLDRFAKAERRVVQLQSQLELTEQENKELQSQVLTLQAMTRGTPIPDVVTTTAPTTRSMSLAQSPFASESPSVDIVSDKGTPRPNISTIMNSGISTVLP